VCSTNVPVETSTAPGYVICPAYSCNLFDHYFPLSFPIRSSCMGGFLSTELVGKRNALFRRLKRFGYCSCNITVSDLIIDSDTGLFRNMCSPSHCLHHMLPCPRMCDNFRDRGHNFQHKKSFIMRALYNFV